jgi:predicted transcriptional regulator
MKSADRAGVIPSQGAAASTSGGSRSHNSPFPASRYESLAMMIVEGLAPADIAERMSVSTRLVSEYMTSKAPEAFRQVLAAYREKINSAVIDRRFKFVDMAEKAYRRIDEALDADDDRLKAETAWKVVDEVAPRRQKADVEINVTQNTQVNAQILEATQGIANLFKELKSNPAESFTKHLKVGEEALPVAYRRVVEEEEAKSVIDTSIEDITEGEPVEPPA